MGKAFNRFHAQLLEYFADGKPRLQSEIETKVDQDIGRQQRVSLTHTTREYLGDLVTEMGYLHHCDTAGRTHYQSNPSQPLRAHLATPHIVITQQGRDALDNWNRLTDEEREHASYYITPSGNAKSATAHIYGDKSLVRPQGVVVVRQPEETGEPVGATAQAVPASAPASPKQPEQVVPGQVETSGAKTARSGRQVPQQAG